MIGITIATVLALLAAPALAADPDTSGFDPAAAFESRKSLEGEWVGTRVSGGDPTTATYRVTAAGSAVVKTYAPGQPYEMITVYHMDGEDLMLTHYCAVGNQPRMKFETSPVAKEIRFGFAGGTNFDPTTDTHAHEGWTRIVDSNTVETESLGYRDGKPAAPTRTIWERSR